MASSVTVPQVVKPAPEISKTPVVAPAPAKSKAGLMIGVGVALILIVALGVGGFMFWKWKATGTGQNAATANTPAVTNTPVEISRYWLELEPATKGGQTTPVAGLVPIASGQSFRFHFSFNEDGYLYIFGPGGDTNEPTAFLTTKPLPATGFTSNKITKGVGISFPSGEMRLTLDKKPGTDNFTVIFSKTQLASPSFLNEPVTGQPLSAAQQADLKAFAVRLQGKRPVTELDESNPRSPFVKVKAAANQTGDPVVFDIRIQHN